MKNSKRQHQHQRTGKKSTHPEICSLRVVDLSRAGAGVAKDDTGRVIFIPYTAPGDWIKVKILSQKSQYAQAELLEVLEPSPQRQEPPCPVYGRCGGCEWQHITYALQWQTKFQGVEEALARFKVPVSSSLQQYPAKHVWSYRNRIQLRGFRDMVGFYAKSSHNIIAVERCVIARQELNDQIESIRKQGESLTTPYKVELEVLPNGEVRCDWNSTTAVSGFQQINSEQNQNLKQWVFDNISRDLLVLDLYGGAANLSAQLAPYSPHIDCVDLTVPENPADQWPANISFHGSDVFPWVVKKAQQMRAQKAQTDAPKCVAIIDPPRGGMPEQLAEFIQCLQQINVCELIAVGCKTDTWARDLAGFIQQGWFVEKAAVFDFFPQTAHVETAALLKRTLRKKR